MKTPKRGDNQAELKKRVASGLLLAFVLILIVSGFVSRCDNPGTRPFGSARGSARP